jgi:predicted amidohydrolase YtcJ
MSITMDDASPLFEQIKEDIKSKIQRGIYSPGAKIPTEVELIAEYDVSRITIRRAVEELCKEGYLEKNQGRGTYVKNKKIFRKIEQLEKKITAQKDIVHVMFGNHLEKKFVKNEAAEKMLERVMPDKAVVLFTEGHATCLMNKKAKEEFRFDEDHCYSEAIYRIMPLYLNDRFFIEKELISYMKLLNSRGITSVKEMGFDDFYGFTDVLEEMELNHELTLRIAFMSQPVGAEPNIKYAKDMEQKFKGDYVRFSGFNQMTDGLILKKEGHLLEPYEGTTITCKKEIDYEKLEKQVLEADENGIRYTLHSEGDGAFHEILNIYEKCRKKNGKLENRHGITDLELTDPEDEKSISSIGVLKIFLSKITRSAFFPISILPNSFSLSIAYWLLIVHASNISCTVKPFSGLILLL